jgi:hypothetical protein
MRPDRISVDHVDCAGRDGLADARSDGRDEH